jgi:hypothetical protein
MLWAILLWAITGTLDPVRHLTRLIYLSVYMNALLGMYTQTHGKSDILWRRHMCAGALDDLFYLDRSLYCQSVCYSMQVYCVW